MKLEEAIYVLGLLITENLAEGDDEATKAQGLGIEALKRIQYLQETDPCCCDGLLPGETEE